jgi:oligoendopeptidase F
MNKLVTSADTDISDLPAWNLDDLYTGRDAPELKADFEKVTRGAEAFQKAYEGKVASLDGDGLGVAIADYEQISETLGRILSYAGLLSAADKNDVEIAKFHQTAGERANSISTGLVFFTLEINRLDEDALARMIEGSSELGRFAPWLRDLRDFRPYQLSDELERLLLEKQVIGRGAWNRLFDETMAGLTFTVDRKRLTSAEVFHLLSDTDGGVRKKAAKSIGKVLGENARLSALITNTLAKDKEIEDRWRGLPEPASSRHLDNQVEPEVVSALIAAVKDAYPRLSHRYYALKAKWMGVKRLDYWDRNAPLPDDDDTTIPWSDARDKVLGAYGAFSPDLAGIGKQFFDKPWIDAPVRPGKDSGAFAHPTVPSAHPYLLVNYQGKVRDVMTLAHELGHGVHQVLAADQGLFLSDTPLTLAETASVFGEMLTFKNLVADETDPARRRVMIASKVEDMINTVVRQVAFYEFERRVHDARRDGELTPDQLGDIWMLIQEESLGPIFRYDKGYRNFWSYIPHFIHAPFYVYAYAFGDCLVNSLYGVYEDGIPDFEAKYLEMLRAGGTLRHKELLAPFGLDASDPEFWSRGLDVISGLIDELED